MLLVEPSAYSIDLTELSAAGTSGAEIGAEGRTGAASGPKAGKGKGKGKARGRKAPVRKPKPGAHGKKAPKGYAEAHGRKRGGTKKLDALVGPPNQPPLDVEALDEGLLVFVQTTLCRRKVWLTVFESHQGEPLKSVRDEGRAHLRCTADTLTVPCCDLCDPKLLDYTRPGPKPISRRQQNVQKGLPDIRAQLKLDDWREAIFERDHAGAQFDSEAILPNDLLADIVCLPPTILVSEKLVQYLRTRWVWWDRYGDELTIFIRALGIQYTPIAKATRGTARAVTEPSANSGSTLSGPSQPPNTAPPPAVVDGSTATQPAAAPADTSLVPSERPAAPSVSAARTELHGFAEKRVLSPESIGQSQRSETPKRIRTESNIPASYIAGHLPTASAASASPSPYRIAPPAAPGQVYHPHPSTAYSPYATPAYAQAYPWLYGLGPYPMTPSTMFAGQSLAYQYSSSAAGPSMSYHQADAPRTPQPTQTTSHASAHHQVSAYTRPTYQSQPIEKNTSPSQAGYSGELNSAPGPSQVFSASPMAPLSVGVPSHGYQQDARGSL